MDVLPYHDTRPDPPAWTPLRVVLITALVLTLGFGGAVFGIHVANVNSASPTDPNSPGPSPSHPEPSPSPSSSPSPTPSPTPEPSNDPSELSLPFLTGMDFRDARQTVRELDLDWQLSFGGLGNDPTVVATWPLPGATVQPGDRVRIFVVGAAPRAQAPDILGVECAEAAGMVVDAGLYPRYRTEVRDGTVIEVDEQSDLHWNDELAFACAD
jgi:hypothetical protein